MIVREDKPAISRRSDTVRRLDSISVERLYKFQLLRPPSQVKFLNGRIRSGFRCISWNPSQVHRDAVIHNPEAEAVIRERLDVDSEDVNLAPATARSVVSRDLELVQTKEPVGAGRVNMKY